MLPLEGNRLPRPLASVKQNRAQSHVSRYSKIAGAIVVNLAFVQMAFATQDASAPPYIGDIQADAQYGPDGPPLTAVIRLPAAVTDEITGDDPAQTRADEKLDDFPPAPAAADVAARSCNAIQGLQTQMVNIGREVLDAFNNGLGRGCRGWIATFHGSLNDRGRSNIEALGYRSNETGQLVEQCRAKIASGQRTLEEIDALVTQAGARAASFNSILGQVSADIGQINGICGRTRTGVIVTGAVAAGALTIWAIAAATPVAAGTTAAASGGTGAAAAAGTSKASAAMLFTARHYALNLNSIVRVWSGATRGTMRVRIVNIFNPTARNPVYVLQRVDAAGNGVGSLFYTYLSRAPILTAFP